MDDLGKLRRAHHGQRPEAAAAGVPGGPLDRAAAERAALDLAAHAERCAAACADAAAVAASYGADLFATDSAWLAQRYERAAAALRAAATGSGGTG